MRLGRREFAVKNVLASSVPNWLATLLILWCATTADAQQLQTLLGHVPAVVQHLQPIGRLPATNHLHLAIGLPLHNRKALTNLLQQMYEPKSPQFRHYLTPDQFTEKFGPAKQDYAAVINFAKANGFTVRQSHSNRMLLDVDGSVADVESAFHVTMRVYQHPTEARTFYAPDAEPSVEADIPILDISGLNNYATLRPSGGSITNGYGSYPSGYSLYIGNDYRAAYVPGVTLTGSGQIIGLFEFDGYYTNDILSYANLAGITNVNLTNVQVDGSSGIPGSSGIYGANAEVSGDIEQVISMAPDAQVIVYEGNNDGTITPFIDVMNRMATDNLAKQISCSWGYSVVSLVVTTGDQIFQEFALQGQSFFQASGDSGANWGSSPAEEYSAWPSDNPYITSVGGTALSTSGPGGFWVSETVWNDHYDASHEGNSASSGGISPNYPIPSWQDGVDMSANGGSTTMRNFPDVAAVTTDIAVISGNSAFANWYDGTSFAAPLWAGFIALVNQQAAANGQPTVGFINPAIYAIADGPSYTSAFHDITIGDNTNGLSSNEFLAVPGYDLCTGLGSPAGQNLITLLLNPNETLAISPGTGFTSANGPFGEPFNINSQNFILTNMGPASLEWSLVNTSLWLNVLPTSGTLAGGAAATVTANLTSAAGTLPPGVYTANVWFTNLTSGVAQSRQFTLQVGQTLVQNGGFESGDFSYWTGWGFWDLDGNQSDFVYTYAPDSHSGNDLAFFSVIQDAPIYLSQTLPTINGQIYLISFWLGYAVGDLSVTWNGTSLFCQTNLDFAPHYGDNVWTNVQFLASAPATSTVLQFELQIDSSGLLGDPGFELDDVSVTPVPTPSITGVTQTNGSISLTWNALSGLMYQVQSCTDLTQTNWINLAGGPIAATNATISASDVIGPDPQRFYRVILLP
jgi:hypothetical protein